VAIQEVGVGGKHVAEELGRAEELDDVPKFPGAIAQQRRHENVGGRVGEEPLQGVECLVRVGRGGQGTSELLEDSVDRGAEVLGEALKVSGPAAQVADAPGGQE
jgi:hypothetical protein